MNVMRPGQVRFPGFDQKHRAHGVAKKAISLVPNARARLLENTGQLHDAQRKAIEGDNVRVVQCARSV